MDKSKLFALAEKAVLKNQNDKALEALEKIVHADPRDVKALNKAADLYLKKGQSSKAIEYLFRVGELYDKDGFYSKAIAIYKRILKIESGQSSDEMIETHQKLANLYGHLGLVSDAMSHYKIVVGYFDKHGDKEALLLVLKKVSDLDPSNIDSQLKLAELFVTEGKADDAVDALGRLANSFESNHQIPDLILVYEKWISLFPKDVVPLRKLVQTYLKASEPKKALAKLQAVFRADPYNAEVLELLSATFREMKQPEKAKAVDIELIKIYRKSNEANKLAEVEGRVKGNLPEEIHRLSQSDSKSADEKSVRKAIDQDSIDPAEALIRQAVLGNEEKKVLSECDVYLKYGLAEKAREVLNSEIQSFPKSLPLRWKLKQVLQELMITDQVSHALSEIVMLAKDQNRDDWVDVASNELRNLDQAHPSLGKPSASSMQTKEADGPLENFDVNESGLSQGLEDSEISIIVDDDLISGEEEAPEFLLDDKNAESDVLDLGIELSAEPDADIENFLEAEQEKLQSSAKSEAADAASSQDDENVKPEDDPAEEEVEFLLSDSDFSDDELSALDSSLGPSAESAKVSDADSEEVELEIIEEAPLDLGAQSYSSDSETLDLSVEAEAVEERGLNIASVGEDAVDDADFEVRQGLEEVAFFRSQGLEEEADNLLAELKKKFPEHTDWTLDIPVTSAGRKLAEPAHDSKGKEKLDKKDVELEALGAKMKLTVQEDQRSDEDSADFFDLAGELADEFADDEDDDEAKDVPAEVSAVFDAFKQGVSESVSDDDFQTHYDLGIAYREMDLLEDAIKEFRICSKLTGHKVSSLYQIGLCQITRENYDAAKKSFDEALKEGGLEDQEKLSISYELAEVLFKLNEKEDARKLYEEVKVLDPEFREVKERLAQC